MSEQIEEWISTTEAAKILDVTPRHVLNLIKKGVLISKPRLVGVPKSPNKILKSSALSLLEVVSE